VFVSEDTFMPTHRDSGAAAPGETVDRSKAIGISLIPATGGVGMDIWDPVEERVHNISGHCLLFDDSRWHGVPMTSGVRITMRVFGDLDVERLTPRMSSVLTAGSRRVDARRCA
jgi:hypothetical protein